MAWEPSRHSLSRRFSLPNSLPQLAPFRAQLRRLLRDLDLPEPTIHDIVLATHEAIVNAMVHGKPGEETRRVEVEVAAEGECLVVQVADEGEGFAWREWLQRGRERATPPEAIRGRGILVMAAVMDDVAYNERGNVVRLTKWLGGQTLPPKA